MTEHLVKWTGEAWKALEAKPMIEGVQLKQLTTDPDERGFFREVLRSTDEIFSEGFGQWSHSSMYSGVIKAFHIHQRQYDLWHVPIGVIKAVLVDFRGVTDKPIEWLEEERPFLRSSLLRAMKKAGGSLPTEEYLLGDNQPAQVLRIPPGVAHGLKVLQGPAHLFYVTSEIYNPADEGRIPYDALGYNWHEVKIT